MSVATYRQSGGTLTLDFPTLTPHGQIIASGALSLGGTLTITNSGSVSPSGQVNLLQGASLTGSFSTINNPFTDATVHTSTNTHRVYLNFGGCHGVWSSTSTSNDYWGLDTNWSSGSCYPGANPASSEDTATFNDVAGAPSALTVIMANSTGSAALDLTALYQLNFNAQNTNFNIVQDSGAGSITMNAEEGPALIAISGGFHTLNVPVTLDIDTTLQLTGGTLNFDTAAAITGGFTLTVSGTSGAWGNSAAISPTTLILESGSIDNLGTFQPTTLTIAADASDSLSLGNFNTISPTGALSISGLGMTSVINFSTLSSGTSFTIGATGSPSFSNTGTTSSGTTFSIEGGTIANTSAGRLFSTNGFTISGGNVANTSLGLIYASSGQPFSISGGTITNQSLGTFGSESIESLASELTISGGTFSNDAAYALAQAVQVSGGTVTNTSGGFFFSEAGNLTISGGTVTNTSGSSLFSGVGNLTISGGTVTNSLASYLFSTLGDLTITGGTVTNDATSNLFAEGGNVVFSGGVLSSSGLVSATGNYTQSGSAQLELGVLNTSSFGNVSVDGTATLGGGLTVSALPGFAMSPGDKIDLVTAPHGVSSTFSTVSFQNFPSSLIVSIAYLPEAVELDVEAAVPAHLNGASAHIIFTSVNQHNFLITQKAYQLGKRMQGPLTTPHVARQEDTPEILYSTVGEAGAPERDPSLLLAQVTLPEQKEQQLTSRIEEASQNAWNFYAGPVADFGNVKTSGDQIGAGFSSVGGLAGFDYVIQGSASTPCFAGVGAAWEFREKWIKADEHFGTATIDKIQGTFYSTVIPKAVQGLAFEALVGFGYTWDHLKRNTGPNQQFTASGNTHEKIVDGLLETEYTFSRRAYPSMPQNFSVTPLANLQYIVDWIDGYTEHGAGIYNLRVGSQTIQSLTTDLGFRLDYLYTASSWSCRFEVDGRWQHQYFNLNQDLTFTAFNFTDQSTLAQSVAPGRNSLLLSADVLFTFAKGWQLEGYASYQLNKLLYSTYFYLGFGKEF